MLAAPVQRASPAERASPAARLSKNQFQSESVTPGLRAERAESSRNLASQRLLEYQRSNREPLYTKSVSQPVGGRLNRSYRINTPQPKWTPDCEAAYLAAFGKSSHR